MPSNPSTARYRTAWKAGHSGRNLPEGLASLADQDPRIDQAHDAGRNGVTFDDFLEGQGLAPSSSPAPAKPSSSSSGGAGLGERISSGGENLGSVALGFLLAALALSVIQYGPKGPLYWFQSKFLNDAKAPAGGAKSSSSSSSSTSSSSGPGVGITTPATTSPGDLLPGASSSVPPATSSAAGPLEYPAGVAQAVA